MRPWTSLANCLAENHGWSSSANQLWDAHRWAPANKEAASGVLNFFDFKLCRLESNYLSRRWWYIIDAVVVPCLYLSTKPPFDGNIQNFNLSRKVKLTRSRQSRCISPLLSLVEGGVPPREMFPGGWTSHCNAPAQRRKLSKQRRLYLKGSIPSLISRWIGLALLSSVPPETAPLSRQEKPEQMQDLGILRNAFPWQEQNWLF